MDAPRHVELRRLISPVCTPKRVRTIDGLSRPDVPARSLFDELLHRMAGTFVNGIECLPVTNRGVTS